MSILAVDSVTKTFADIRAVDDLSFAVEPGEIYGFLGGNGAGKTTTLRSIMGLWRPQPGSVTFKDRDISVMATADIARLGIAYVPENMGVFGGLTVEENLILATAKGKFDPSRLRRIHDLFPPLEQFRTKQAWSLSGGQKQMLAVARAIVEPRDLILIDEPTKGLAPSIVAAMAEAFREIAQDTTILLVEQNFNFARSLGRDMAVIDDGRVVHRGTMADFAADTALQGQLLGLSA